MTDRLKGSLILALQGAQMAKKSMHEVNLRLRVAITVTIATVFVFANHKVTHLLAIM